MVYRHPRPNTSHRGRRQFIDAAKSVGEEAIALSMLRPTIDKDVPRCECFDDVYGQGDSSTCNMCFGTTLRGGVKAVTRVWAIFGDTLNAEQQRRRGEWLPDERPIQIDSVPTLYQNDYIIRVLDWEKGVYGDRYSLRAVDEASIRTGRRNHLSQAIDNIAQSTRGQKLTTDHVIYDYKPPLNLNRNRVW